MPSSKEQNKNPLDGKPPSYAEIFRINRADDTPIGKEASSEAVAPVLAKDAESLPPAHGETLEQVTYLTPYKAERSGRIAAAALGLNSIDELPLVYSVEDGRKLAQYVESHAEELKQWFAGDSGQKARAKILPEVDKMFGNGLETRRVDPLLRLFRDRQTSADLNPHQLVDPKLPANGSLFQLMHPVLFNVLLFVVLVIGVFLTFAFFFQGA